MRRLFSILFGLVVLSAFAGTLYFLYSKSEEPPQVFETESPFVTDIVRKTVATGSVVPRREVAIKPQVSGIVQAIAVEPGDMVRRGHEIARIEIVPDMVTLNNAQNRLNRARIQMDNAQKDVERNRRLSADGAISEAMFQEYETAYKNAQEELSSAIDHLELIKKGSTSKTGQTSNTRVRATTDGMVLEVPLEVGNSVIEANTFNDGTTIATIADMDEMVFEGKVDESEVGKIRVGMDLLLTIGAIDDRTYPATLEHIAPKGVEEAGAIQFEIRAALNLDEGDFVRANLSANADIVLDRRDQVLAIQEGLLQFDGEQAFVEVETAPQVFERRDVETGLSDGIAIEVVSGVADTDKIKKPS